MTKLETLIQHHNIRPDSTFDTTLFSEREVWHMAAQGTLTYDQADHMAGGDVTLIEAKAYIAAWDCNCEICDY
jgi:hypothetical protein